MISRGSRISISSEVETDFVSLIPKTRCTASCVGPAPSGKAGHFKPFPLSEVPNLRVQEALIIKDIMYVLLGLEGSYIRYSDKFEINDSKSKLKGPDYKIAKHLDTSLKEITKKVIRLGKYYVAIETFCELYNSEIYGGTMQLLCFQLREFLKEYRAHVNEIEYNFRFSPNFSLIELNQGFQGGTLLGPKVELLYQIVTSLNEENVSRLEKIGRHNELNFTSLIDSIKNDLKNNEFLDVFQDDSNSQYIKGGLILQLIQKKMDENIGDFSLHHFLENFYRQVSGQFVQMLNQWLSTGEIDDTYDEFIIKQNSVTNDEDENYWDSRFVIRKDGLIRPFDDKQVQFKLILMGKYLNILKKCGVNHLPLELPQIDNISDKNIHLKIDQAYQRANRHISQLYFQGVCLWDNLSFLKRTFFLNRNSNFHQFVSKNFAELKRDKSTISVSKLQRTFALCHYNETHPLFKLMELEYDSTNIYSYILQILQFKPLDAETAVNSADYKELKALLNQTFEVENPLLASANTQVDNYVINVLNLEIKLPFPLNLLVNSTFVIQYQIIFRNLCVVVFLEKLIESSWRETSMNGVWRFKGLRSNPRLYHWILKSRGLLHRMNHFVHLVQHYLFSDVIELNWRQFTEFSHSFEKKTNEGSFQDFYSLHLSLEKLLTTILTDSGLTSQSLIQLQVKIFVIIILFSNFILSIRKTIILMDVELCGMYAHKLGSKVYDEEKNAHRLQKLELLLQDYIARFNSNIREYVQGLKLFGENECTSFLKLASALEGV